jgi:hypothetical protein
MGWSRLTNGELLAAAASCFDVLVTVDQNLQFQRNLAEILLPVIVLIAADNRLESLKAHAPHVQKILTTPLVPGLMRLDGSGRIEAIRGRTDQT